jgi:hypothetical protein
MFRLTKWIGVAVVFGTDLPRELKSPIATEKGAEPAATGAQTERRRMPGRKLFGWAADNSWPFSCFFAPAVD